MGGFIMASIINASTSGAGGLISTADASGVLQLQTAGTTAVTIDASGNVGVGTSSPLVRLDVRGGRLDVKGGTAGSVYNTALFCNAEATNTANTGAAIYLSGSGGVDRSASITGINTGGATNSHSLIFSTSSDYSSPTERWRISSTGLLSNTGADGTAYLTLKAGTATASTAPLKYTAGTNLSAVEAGAVEYDGVNQYFTANTTSGRGYVPTNQIFRLTANGAAIGATIANFFGANSAINMAAGGVYEIEAYCYFTKTTAGTVTVTATTSLAPVNLNGTVQYGAIAGGTATGAANQISLFNSTATAAAFGASGSLTTGVNHLFIIKLIVESNASASNLRINFTESAGTVTPLRGSYYKVTRLPATNTGSFAA